MSLATWKKEFYPKPANKVSKKNAIEHSLQKWKGLTPVNIRKHKLEVIDSRLIDNDIEKTFFIDADTCALCQIYLDNNADDSNEACYKCPLYRVLGQSCDRSDKPYEIYLNTCDPMPMIRALRRALKRAQK